MMTLYQLNYKIPVTQCKVQVSISDPDEAFNLRFDHA